MKLLLLLIRLLHYTMNNLVYLKIISSAVESRFLKPPRETKIGSRNQELEISEVKLQ